MSPPQAAAKKRWQLRPMQIPGLRPSYAIEVRGLTIGRDPANSLALDDQMYPHVSSVHVRVLLADVGPVVEDLDSKNGTFLNGERVEQPTRVSSGDVIQLGSMGPSFSVYDSESMKSTMALHISPEDRKNAEADFGKTTIMNLKRVLGIPQDADGVKGMVARGQRRQRTRILVGVGLLTALMTCGFFYIQMLGDWRELEFQEKLARELSALERQNDEKLAAERRRGETSRNTLIEDLNRMQARLAELKNQAGASAEEVEGLSRELEQAGKRLDMFDPVNLEQSRVESVRRVHNTVALVEAQWRYRERVSGELIYNVINKTTLAPDFHLGPERGGEPFTREGTGSGFCVSPEGYIITNAHVVQAEEIQIPGMEIDSEPASLEVVFTGESRRIPARIICVADQDDDDFALLKIEPFEGMPCMESFTTDSPPPPVGSEVFVLGFPLGKHALHEGETMIATAFTGHMSREVAPYLQVDAAVYPGNSGGPLVDRQGRVIGVVVGVQTIPRGGLASTIGYVLPISRASAVWPPPEEPERVPDPDDDAGLTPAKSENRVPVGGAEAAGETASGRTGEGPR